MDIAKKLEKLLKTDLTDAQVNEIQAIVAGVRDSERELAEAKQSVKMYSKLYNSECDKTNSLHDAIFAIVNPVKTQDPQAITDTLKALPATNVAKAIEDTVKAALSYK